MKTVLFLMSFTVMTTAFNAMAADDTTRQGADIVIQKLHCERFDKSLSLEIVEQYSAQWGPWMGYRLNSSVAMLSNGHHEQVSQADTLTTEQPASSEIPENYLLQVRERPAFLLGKKQTFRMTTAKRLNSISLVDGKMAANITYGEMSLADALRMTEANAVCTKTE